MAERPTYKQNWPAYNAAQRHEKTKLQGLLRDLCQGIEEPPQVMGRPRVPLRDAVFACVFKVYSTVSGARSMCDMEDAHLKGFTSRPVHYNSIAKHMEMAGLTPILYRLIDRERQAAQVGRDRICHGLFGVRDEPIRTLVGPQVRAAGPGGMWAKCHAMTGIKTNVVTAVKVDLRHDGDTWQFVPLVDAPAKAFRIREVSADSAYSAGANMDAVEAHGGTAYIAFKASVTGAMGGLSPRCSITTTSIGTNT